MPTRAALEQDRDRSSRAVPSRWSAASRRARAPRRLAGPARWHKVAVADRRAAFVLAALPFLLYLPFSLAGHPVMPGDNLTQNYPLRVLAGEAIRSGHLPAWDPLIWSGTPLLAGWNGGSLFPATWLFAVLPGVAAWTVAYALVPAVAALGAFVLLRQLSCRTLPAAFGALAFAYTGFMSGQVVHLGLVQGTALMPWTLVALELAARRAGPRRHLAGLALPVALLGVSSALTVLAGDPRAVSTTAVVDLVYVLALIVRASAGRLRLAGAAGAGAVLGAACSAVQWLPGLHFVHASQRGSTAYAFFGAGSLSLGHTLSFLLAPYLFGGNGNFGLPNYSGSYNLPELTIGVGLVAAVAFAAFLPELARSLLGRVRRGAPGTAGADGGGRGLGVWYVLAVVGLLLTLGTNTPLAHLVVHVPFFGGERLQNRNAAIVDLALVVLLAFLLDDLLARHPRPGGALASRASRGLALVPLAAAAGLVAAAYLAPAGLEGFLDLPIANTRVFSRMTPDLVWELVVVAGAALVALAWRRPARRLARAGLYLLVACDLAVFVANDTYAGAPSPVLAGASPVTAAVSALAGPSGRFALYNPLTYPTPGHSELLHEVGAPDLGIVGNRPSVEGYGSLVGSAYQDATRTHDYENLAAPALSGPTFDVLDLHALVTMAPYFEQVLAKGEHPPVAGSPVARAENTPAHTTAAARVAGPFPVPAHARRTFLLAAPIRVHRVALRLAGPPRAPGLRIGLADLAASPAPGRRVAPVATRPGPGTATARFAASPVADEIVVANPTDRPALVEAVLASVGSRREVVDLNGPLQGRLLPSHWRYAGRIGSLVAYTNRHRTSLAWLEPAGAGRAEVARRAPGRVRVLPGAPDRPDQEVVTSTGPALLVRSETFSPGWSARIAPVGGGPARVVPVRRLGLVQAVPLGPGRFRVTWRYAPRSLSEGLLLSLAGLVVLVALGGAAWVSRRRGGARTWAERDHLANEA